MKRLTTKEWIEKARAVHGDKYDYSLVNYQNALTKVSIICPKHGVFLQIPNLHLLGNRCPLCAKESRFDSLEDFVNKANKVHNYKYDYSKVKYINSKTPVSIICPIHGEFLQKPLDHLLGRGCQKCKKDKLHNLYRLTTSEFIEKSAKIHNNKYIYDKTVYNSSRDKVIITCPIHGDFEQIAEDHLRGSGCPKCSLNAKLTLEEFVNKANNIHGNFYNYSKANYVNNKTLITIICPIHGEFLLIPNSHLNGCGCPKCNRSHGEKSVSNFLERNNIKFIELYEISIPKDINPSGKALIDFYLPDYNLFIEYNGEQHYIPIEHFGGELKFEQQLKRDLYIRNYCDEKNIKLIEIKYSDNIEEFLIGKLSFDNYKS